MEQMVLGQPGKPAYEAKRLELLRCGFVIDDEYTWQDVDGKVFTTITYFIGDAA